MLRETRKLEDYADILDYEWHGTVTHTPMPMSKRAAQFSPFAALSGLGDRFDEEMRYTDVKAELTEDKREELDRALLSLMERTAEKKPSEALMTWFIPDETKDGGSYRTDRVSVKKIDRLRQVLVMSDHKEIPLENITEILPDESAP